MAGTKSKHRHYTRMNKGGRNEKRYAKYRARVGKPLGKGVPGNKAGRNRTPRSGGASASERSLT